jgi:hypothetical protein
VEISIIIYAQNPVELDERVRRVLSDLVNEVKVDRVDYL